MLLVSSVVFGQQRHTVEAISTFPNPVVTSLFIEVDFTLFEAERWQLHDLLGNLIREGEIVEGEKTFEVDLSEQKNDIYLLRIYGASGQLITRRIFKN